MAGKNDEVKARKRFVDQPGQWVDTTPASVKKRQAKAWRDLYTMMGKNPDGSTKKSNTQTKKK